MNNETFLVFGFWSGFGLLRLVVLTELVRKSVLFGVSDIISFAFVSFSFLGRLEI